MAIILLYVLHREQKQIQQDLNLYRVPADLYELFSSLIAILNRN
ncbi:hypothetical protein [Lusitaniella coriacea]|nr:hypothetical protein [Lusitaniella coriacea]